MKGKIQFPHPEEGGGGVGDGVGVGVGVGVGEVEGEGDGPGVVVTFVPSYGGQELRSGICCSSHEVKCDTSA